MGFLKVLEWIVLVLLIGICTFVLIFGLVWGGFTSIRDYARAFIKYWNPYDSGYTDKSKKIQMNVRHRNYFFGPCYYSICHTVKESVQGIILSFSILSEDLFDFGWVEWIDDWFDYLEYVLILWKAQYIVGSIVIGGTVVLTGTLVHGCVCAVAGLLEFLLYGSLWLIDRTYLKIYSIKAMCPSDKERFTVPTYKCLCGKPHTNLVPSPYGIFRHACVCGKKLPCTFMNGRSVLEAVCPRCGATLAASYCKQFNLSLVGSSSSGKTVYLTSYFQRMRENLGKIVSVEVPAIHRDEFRTMEERFLGIKPEESTTKDDKTHMYSVIWHGGKLKVPVQFSLFDVAGEVFDDPELRGLIHSRDMVDSNGILLVVDPLSSLRMREEAANMGLTVRNVSDDVSAKVVNNFATYLHTANNFIKRHKKIERPVAVIITKIDMKCVRPLLSHSKIGEKLRHSDPDVRAIAIQDDVCRSFLENYGYQSLLLALESNFSNFHFFPISSNGGVEPGQKYEPDGYVEQPIQWMLRMTAPNIADALEIPDEDAILRGAYIMKAIDDDKEDDNGTDQVS